MTKIDPIRIVQRTVDQDTYGQLDHERYRRFDRIVETRTRLQDDILPRLGEPARQAVKDYILAEQELRSAEFCFMCVKVDNAEAAPDAEPTE